MIKQFFELNKSWSRGIDRLFVRSRGTGLREEFLENLPADAVVADVGGGKKPVFLVEGRDKDGVSAYEGFDIDLDELKQAEDLYHAIHVVDLTKPVDEAYRGRFTNIFCISTLEHVTDDTVAMQNLAGMLQDGGELYIKVPYKFAIFAMLNRVMPQEAKRKILHYIFPDKIGDGFPVYYKGCRLTAMKNAQTHGLRISRTNKHYTSSYFMFFLPFYLVWRLGTVIQYVVDRDYCESFEVILKKQGDASSSGTAADDCHATAGQH